MRKPYRSDQNFCGHPKEELIWLVEIVMDLLVAARTVHQRIHKQGVSQSNSIPLTHEQLFEVQEMHLEKLQPSCSLKQRRVM